MSQKFAAFLLTKVLGWDYVDFLPPEKKVIILGVPHTSIWDLIVSYLFGRAIGGDIKVIVKGKFFVGPLGWILRKIGAYPLDEGKGTSMALGIINTFKKHEQFHLSLAPEGTRKAIKRWKTGFHMIAKAADVTIYAGFFDWGRKLISCGEKFELTDDANADLIRLQKHYIRMGVKGKIEKDLAYMDIALKEVAEEDAATVAANK